MRISFGVEVDFLVLRLGIEPSHHHQREIGRTKAPCPREIVSAASKKETKRTDAGDRWITMIVAVRRSRRRFRGQNVPTKSRAASYPRSRRISLPSQAL